MPAARRAPRALTAVAPCTLSLATAGPALARPAGHGPVRSCIGCAAHRPHPRQAAGARTSSLAGTLAPRARIGRGPRAAVIEAPDGAGAGATTLAIVLIAGGALLAGGGAG